MFELYCCCSMAASRLNNTVIDAMGVYMHHAGYTDLYIVNN